eukprot:TRINITY_DN5359_c0_g1_i3.p1 TRINITY_DN5359_c0_g1~~TRINITY_DN5359_c0_g1_i3.p1  ORF type:complete len:159 (-),score=53.05 TRINITY_DN5359_c0_g1_i3:26-502(-)
MRLTPSPPPPPSKSQAETLSSLCDWWMNTKEEALPGICHWFIHPGGDQRGSTVRLSHYRPVNGSSFSSVGMSVMEHPVHSSISIIFILGGVLFILLIVAFITCITRRKTIERAKKSQKKDHPPDYVAVIKMKIKEDEELPSYSEAILIESKMEKVDKK